MLVMELAILFAPLELGLLGRWLRMSLRRRMRFIVLKSRTRVMDMIIGMGMDIIEDSVVSF
jgi:hypothetical protein